jgi:arsenite-transporting ATPase
MSPECSLDCTFNLLYISIALNLIHIYQSTDPAHNLSDAFGQKFSKDATKVNGFENLFAMEIDPTSAIQEMVEQCTWLYYTLSVAYMSIADSNGMMGSMMQDLAFAIPGVDEAMSFAEIMKCVSLLDIGPV